MFGSTDTSKFREDSVVEVSYDSKWVTSFQMLKLSSNFDALCSL